MCMSQFFVENGPGLKVAHTGERHEFGGGSGGGGGAHRSAGHGGFLIRGGSLYSHPGQAIQSFNHQTKGYHVCINIRLSIPELQRFAFRPYEFVKMAKIKQKLNRKG